MSKIAFDVLKGPRRFPYGFDPVVQELSKTEGSYATELRQVWSKLWAA
jgi:hypothetical protein